MERNCQRLGGNIKVTAAGAQQSHMGKIWFNTWGVLTSAWLVIGSDI